MGWKVYEWTGWSMDGPDKEKRNEDLPSMDPEETMAAIKYLREHHYPVPEDCPKEQCPSFRPACSLGICHVATVLCGDF